MAETETKLSRQRRYQLSQRAKGLCRNCPEPAYKGGRCARHWEEHLRSKRKRVQGDVVQERK